jgi:hypothetical protein
VGIVALIVNLAALVVVTIAVRALAGGAMRPVPVPPRAPERVGADDGRRM